MGQTESNCTDLGGRCLPGRRYQTYSDAIKHKAGDPGKTATVHNRHILTRKSLMAITG